MGWLRLLCVAFISSILLATAVFSLPIVPKGGVGGFLSSLTVYTNVPADIYVDGEYKCTTSESREAPIKKIPGNFTDLLAPINPLLRVPDIIAPLIGAVAAIAAAIAALRNRIRAPEKPRPIDKLKETFRYEKIKERAGRVFRGITAKIRESVSRIKDIFKRPPTRPRARTMHPIPKTHTRRIRILKRRKPTFGIFKRIGRSIRRFVSTAKRKISTHFSRVRSRIRRSSSGLRRAIFRSRTVRRRVVRRSRVRRIRRSVRRSMRRSRGRGRRGGRR